MEWAFFDYFFAGAATVGTLGPGYSSSKRQPCSVTGTLSTPTGPRRYHSVADLKADLAEWACSPGGTLTARFGERSPKLVDIDLIPREHTSLVGYISAGEVVAEDERCAFLRAQLPAAAALPAAAWPAFEAAVLAAAGAAERPALTVLLVNFQKRNAGATVAQFAAHLEGVAPVLNANTSRLASVRTTNWHLDLRKSRCGGGMGTASLPWEDGGWQPSPAAQEAHHVPSQPRCLS